MAVTVSEFNAIYPSSAADRLLSRSVIALPKNVTRQGRRRRKFTARTDAMRSSKAWRNIGGLKRQLLDLWTEERNALAKRAVENIRNDGLTVRGIR